MEGKWVAFLCCCLACVPTKCSVLPVSCHGSGSPVRGDVLEIACCCGSRANSPRKTRSKVTRITLQVALQPGKLPFQRVGGE